MIAFCVWGLSGCGGGSHKDLVWPELPYCFHWKGCWVSSAYPSFLPVVGLCWTRQSCSLFSLWAETQKPEMREGRPNLSSAQPCQLSLMQLPPNDFPTDIHRSLAYETDLSLTTFVKERFPLQPSSANSALIVFFPQPHLPPRLGVLFSSFISLPSQSDWAAYCAPCEQWMMPINWWNQSPGHTDRGLLWKPSAMKPFRHLCNSLRILVFTESCNKDPF